jgi:hypothetical protein
MGIFLESRLGIIASAITWFCLSTFHLACDSATPPPSPRTSDPSTTTKKEKKSGQNDDSGDPNAGDTPEGEFDLCSSGLKVNDRLKTSFSAQINALCNPAQLQALRKTENIYVGKDNKILEISKKLEDKSSTLTLMTSAVYTTNIEDYWAMLRLQFLKPRVFSENFERDPNTTVSQVSPAPNNSNVSFRYENSSGEGGKVDYVAKSELIQLSQGIAYVVATKLTESKETLTDLKGLIVVHKIDDNSIEVFSTSNQQYSHASGQGETYYNRALSSMRAEQKRTWNNAKKADTARNLLGD